MVSIVSFPLVAYIWLIPTIFLMVVLLCSSNRTSEGPNTQSRIVEANTSNLKRKSERQSNNNRRRTSKVSKKKKNRSNKNTNKKTKEKVFSKEQREKEKEEQLMDEGVRYYKAILNTGKVVKSVSQYFDEKEQNV